MGIVDDHMASMAVELALSVTRLRARLRLESAGPTTGWTISQLSTLGRIVNDGPVTAAELAQAEHVRQQSIAETVNALRAGGLVISQRDPRDGRKTLLSATDQARDLVATVWASRSAWLARAIEQTVDPKERATLTEAIALLNRLAECDLDASGEPGWRV